MTIGIIGLGLMGASFASKLSDLGKNVLGVDIHQETIDIAIEQKMIQNGSTCAKEIVNSCDILILALYPTRILPWIQENQNYIKKDCLIMDISGIKSNIIYPVQKILRNDLSFLSIHPMCGRESRGIQFADKTIFYNANFIIVPTSKNTLDEIQIANTLAKEMGFKNISILSIEEHDRMIAFLSQLTHVIAVSLMNTHENANFINYTGDSFRDLTRIASINEDLWSELFLLNKDILLEEIDQFIDSITYFRDALEQDNIHEMKRLFIQSTKRRKMFNKK